MEQQIVDPVNSWLQVVLQGGALGLLGWIIYQAPTWIYKSQENAAAERRELVNTFREEQKLEREACTARHEAIVQAIERQTQVLREEIRKRG